MILGDRKFSRFIGLDLGGGKSRNTAVALLEQNGQDLRVTFVDTRTPAKTPFYDSPLIGFLLEHQRDTLLAVNAPLTLSVCLRCQDKHCPGLGACTKPVVKWFQNEGEQLVWQGRKRKSSKPSTTPYTQRACEIILHKKHGIMPREVLGQGMGPLTARANYLCKALNGNFQLNQNMIEVFPKATIHNLVSPMHAQGYKREVRTWRFRAEILEAISDKLKFDIWREGCLKNDHCFDAVICAYTGYLWASQGWELPEADREIVEEDGWIWFPRDPLGKR